MLQYSTEGDDVRGVKAELMGRMLKGNGIPRCGVLCARTDTLCSVR